MLIFSFWYSFEDIVRQTLPYAICSDLWKEEKIVNKCKMSESASGVLNLLFQFGFKEFKKWNSCVLVLKVDLNGKFTEFKMVILEWAIIWYFKVFHFIFV